MPSRLPPLPMPADLAHDLGLPARDILRGVRRVIAGPLRLLEPVGAMFPEPVQHLVDDLRQSVNRGVREASGVDATSDSDASIKAAAIAVSLTSHQVIGIAPGTSFGLDGQAVEACQVAAFVVLLWLLVERLETEANEAELLDLCYSVSTAQRAVLLAAKDDTLMLADLLRTYARMI